MKVEDKPRYDLYIVSENTPEEDTTTDETLVDHGHLNSSYDPSEDGEERLRIEITEEKVVGENNNDVLDDTENKEKPKKVKKLFSSPFFNIVDFLDQEKGQFSS